MKGARGQGWLPADTQQRCLLVLSLWPLKKIIPKLTGVVDDRPKVKQERFRLDLRRTKNGTMKAILQQNRLLERLCRFHPWEFGSPKWIEP